MKTNSLQTILLGLALAFSGTFNLAQAQEQKGETATPSEIVEHYLALKDHFVQSDAAAAQSKAQDFVKMLPAPKGNVMKQIQSELKMIAENEDLSAQRKHFDALSGAIYEMAQNTDLEMTLYHQFCPMAGEGGAYWLSADKEIRNPYFGDKMLKCGMVKETL